MLPTATALALKALGHDALAVSQAGLLDTADDVTYTFAVAGQRIVVTENFADFAHIVGDRRARELPCTPVVLIRKSSFARGGALAAHLARHLHRWSVENPDPYTGVHWP